MATGTTVGPGDGQTRVGKQRSTERDLGIGHGIVRRYQGLGESRRQIPLIVRQDRRRNDQRAVAARKRARE